MWYDDYYDDDGDHDDDEDKFFLCYDGYKKQGSKSLNKRRDLTYCLASIKMVGLVYDRRRKK